MWPSVTAYLLGTQSSINGTTLINLDTVDHNQGSVFSTSTHLFTAPAAGKYLITGSIYLITGSGRTTPTIYKNGAAFVKTGTGTGNFVSTGFGIVLSLAAGDTIGLGVTSDGAYVINNKWVTDISTYMSVARVA